MSKKPNTPEAERRLQAKRQKFKLSMDKKDLLQLPTLPDLPAINAEVKALRARISLLNSMRNMASMQQWAKTTEDQAKNLTKEDNDGNE